MYVTTALERDFHPCHGLTLLRQSAQSRRPYEAADHHGDGGQSVLTEVRGDPAALDAPWTAQALEEAGVARGATVTGLVSDGFLGTGQMGRTAAYTVAAMLAEVTERGDTMLATMLPRHACHAMDVGALDLLR